MYAFCWQPKLCHWDGSPRLDSPGQSLNDFRVCPSFRLPLTGDLANAQVGRRHSTPHRGRSDQRRNCPWLPSVA